MIQKIFIRSSSLGGKDTRREISESRYPAALLQCEKQNEYARPRLDSTDVEIVYSFEELSVKKNGEITYGHDPTYTI